MLGIIITAIGICLAAFGALYPLHTMVNMTRKRAAEMSASYVSAGDESDADMPIGKFLMEQRRDYRIGLPFLVCGIALQIVGLLIVSSFNI